MTIFGARWTELSLDHVRTYLESAEDEPLLWEAKGADVRPEQIRKAVCAFGNGYQTSYLILGVDETTEGWKLTGVPPQDEPNRWLSDVLAEHVSPLPPFDVRTWPVDAGQVIVVRVDPTPAPPCMFNGTVYERLPGRTQPIRDSLRLQALVSAGRVAHERARTSLMGLEGTAHSHGQTNTSLVFEMRVSPVGYAPTLPKLILTRGFAATVQAAVTFQLLPRSRDGLPGEEPRAWPAHQRRGLTVEGLRKSVAGRDRHATITCTPEAVVTSRTLDIGNAGGPIELVTEAVDQHLVALDRVLHQMHARGGVYVALDGAVDWGGSGGGHRRFFAFEGPVETLLADGLRDALVRQVRRAVGELAFEPGEAV